VIELAAFLYVAGIIVSALVVGAMMLGLAGLYGIWGIVTLMERAGRVRMPRMRVGSWRAAPGFLLRLAVICCVVLCAAVLASV
jgi:hypothetical protein